MSEPDLESHSLRSALSSQPVVVVIRNSEDGGTIDARQFGRVLWDAKIFIFVIALVIGGLSFGQALISKRMYRAEATVVTAESAGDGASGLLGGGLGALGSLVGLTPGALGSRRDEYVALLTSKTLLREYIERKNLMPILFEDMWDAANGRWKKQDPSKVPKLGDGVDKLSKKVIHVQAAKSGLIRITAEWSDPQLAAEWVNDLVKSVNEHVRVQTIEDANRGMEFLGRELKKADTLTVREGIYRLQEANLNKQMLANVQEDYALRTVDVAVPPHRHFSPRLLLQTALGTFLGLLAGMAWALWRRRPEWWIVSGA
jgi:uncharacterized protein involved in exopolysaccharide biosynthesis